MPGCLYRIDPLRPSHPCAAPEASRSSMTFHPPSNRQRIPEPVMARARTVGASCVWLLAINMAVRPCVCFLGPSVCCYVATPHSVLLPFATDVPSSPPTQLNPLNNQLDPPRQPDSWCICTWWRPCYGGGSPSPAALVHSSTQGQGRLRGARDSGRMHRTDVPALPDVRACWVGVHDRTIIPFAPPKTPPPDVGVAAPGGGGGPRGDGAGVARGLRAGRPRVVPPPLPARPGTYA
jgi:hypothetical protein